MRDPGPGAAHAMVVLIALGVWAGSLSFIDLDAMGEYGLISVLPIGFGAALALLCLGFALALARQLTGPILLCYPFALLVALHAVVPLVYEEPRYSYVYKHIAMVRYIVEFGAIDRSVDIYHNWPGVFAAAAVLSELTGVDAGAFANWADPFFALCHALAVLFVARSLTSDPRRVAASVWCYVIASSSSQTYLAPQSSAFFLALVVVGIALRWRRSSTADWSWLLYRFAWVRVASVSRRILRAPFLRRWLLPDRAARPSAPPAVTDPSPLAVVGAMALLAAAVVVSHQLTPYFLVVTLLVLFAAGRCRTGTVAVLVVLSTAFWIYLSYDYVSLHFTLFAFDPFDNIKGTHTAAQAAGSDEFRLAGTAARVMIVLSVGLAALAWWTAPRGRKDTYLWLVTLAPASVLLVQSYGGEAIYRVIMFMLPWTSYLASRFLVEFRRPRLQLRTAAVGLVSTFACLLFLLNYFGLDRVNRIQPQEVRASAWFEQNAPPGSVLAFIAGYWPTPSTADYALHLNSDGNWGAGIFSDSRFEEYLNQSLTSKDIPALLTAWHEMSRSGEVFVALGPTQLAAVETYGYSPPGSIAPFVQALLTDERMRIVHQDGDAYILQVVGEPPYG